MILCGIGRALIIATIPTFILYLFQYGHEYLGSLATIFVTVYIYAYTRIKARDNLTSKDVVVITGCDSGLGYGLALHCHTLGAKVVAGVHNINSLGAQKLIGKEITVYPIDIVDDKSIDQFKEKLKQLLDQENLKLRVVVNNAGRMVFGEFEWQTEQQIFEQVNVNLIGTMKLTSKLVSLARAHASRIIFVCSHCALQPLPGTSVYGSTKAGLLAFATSLRVEMKKCGVKVVNFIPGSFVTESNLLSKQAEYFQNMREAMSDDVKAFYGDYFDRYEQHLSPISNTVNPDKLSNNKIFEIFESCMLDKYPSPVYKCEPWRYKMYHTLCKLSPTCIRDKLIEKFVAMPQWNK